MYRGHLDKQALRQEFQNRFGVVQLEIAHETQEEEHTHVAIDFGRVFESRDRNVFLFCGMNPHIGIAVLTKRHWENCLGYLAKEDPENAHLKQKSFAQQVWEQPNIHAAMITLGNKTNVNSIIKYYEHKPPVSQDREFSGFTWQKELVHFLTTTEPHPRHIHWYTDLKGGAGKTELCTYLHCKYPLRFWLVTEFRTMADIATLIDNALNHEWDGHCVLLDIPRQTAEFDVVYNAMESIKNGILTVSKYHSKLVRLPKRPHVVVLSNVFPNVRKLSLDKWKVYELCHSNGNALTRPDDVTARKVESTSLL